MRMLPIKPTTLEPDDTYALTLKAEVVNDLDLPVTIIGVQWEPVYAGSSGPEPAVRRESATPA